MPFFDLLQNASYRFDSRLGTLVAFSVNANAHVVGIHVTRAYYHHGVGLGFLCAQNFSVDLVISKITFHPSSLATLPSRS